MFDPSQSLFTNMSSHSHSHFPDQFQTSNPNNPYFAVPQPFLASSLTSDPYIHAPGTGPLANSGSHPFTNVGFQVQALICEDPNSVSQNWVVKQSAPISYDVVARPENLNSLLPTSSNSFWTLQPPATDVTTHIPQQTARVGAEEKKILSSGAVLDSIRMCTICNVACNSQEVFNKHMAGQKHAVQAGLAALGEIGPYFAAVRAQFSGAAKKAPKKIKFVQSAWCEICKINCNSNEVYVNHLSGKKHQKNLEQLKKSSNDHSSAPSSTISSTPIIGPAEKPTDTPKSSKKPTGEELEVKRRKILEAGGAAGAIKTCTICNVVCNSQTVFDSHLGGQKHVDMVKKLKEAGKETAGPWRGLRLWL